MWAIAGVLVWTGHRFEETLMREHGEGDVRHTRYPNFLDEMYFSKVIYSSRNEANSSTPEDRRLDLHCKLSPRLHCLIQ